MHKLLCQNVSIFSLFMYLTKRSDTFLFKGFNTFLFGSISAVYTQSSHKKNQQYSLEFLGLYQLLIHHFLCQTVSILLLYMPPKLLTTGINQICVITYPNLFIFDLAYTTRTKLILWSNLNYKND